MSSGDQSPQGGNFYSALRHRRRHRRRFHSSSSLFAVEVNEPVGRLFEEAKRKVNSCKLEN
jgi:hypothetical protein